MATIDSFTFSDDIKPIKQPAVVQRRNRLIARIWEQIQLLKSYESGTEFTVRKLKTVKDIDGVLKRLPLPKRLKPWWFTNSAGVICVSIRYGSSTLELKPGKKIIQAKNTHELLEVLETVKRATADGELDHLIEQASGAFKLNFIRRSPKEN
jgi:hypothetical protein